MKPGEEPGSSPALQILSVDLAHGDVIRERTVQTALDIID